MSRKYLLTSSLLLALMAMSTAANAGSTISDKRYWPNEARASSYRGGYTDSLNSASPYNLIAPQAQHPTSVIGGSPFGRYQGGPKSR
jgi:hypothetical protein